MAKQTETQDRKGRLMRRATVAAVAVAATLIAAKLVAWLVTGSVAILSTLVDSLVDVAASTINLLAVRQALQPADQEHRFGHGKAEALAGLGQAAFIIGSGCFLLIEAVGRLVEPRPVTEEAVGIAVMVFSIVLTLGLVAFQRHVIRTTGSVAIAADSLHFRGDVLMNLGVIVSLAFAATWGWPWFDPIFAIGVVAYLGWSAWKIAAGALDILMDRELPDAARERIRSIVMAHPEVRDMHDLRSRRSGTDTFIQLHLELDGNMSLHDAHEISDAVEAELLDAFPGAEVLIHQDPAGLVEDHPAVRN